jgi:hypothetical protein
MWMSQEELWRRAEASDFEAARAKARRRAREQIEAIEDRALERAFERELARRAARSSGSLRTERRREQDFYSLSDAELRSRFNLGPDTEIVRPGTREWDAAWKVIDPRGRVGTAAERWTGPFNRR